MPITIHEFWKLATGCGLVPAERCRQLQAAFERAQSAAPTSDTKALATWLVASGVLTRYQAATLLAGRGGPFIFDDYIIRERIETGRLGRYFRAASTRDHHAAIVVFAAQLTNDPDELPELLVRAQGALGIVSPHVSRLRQWVASQPARAIVEDLQGQSLRDRLSTQRPTLEVACRIGFQAALGLVAMHARKCVHGNIRPENLWVEPGGTVKILQFPFTVDPAGRGRYELPAADYLAPELCDPNQPATELTDLYGLGCTLYELVGGRVPFPGGAAAEKMRRHQTEVAQRLDRVNPEVPEEVADLVVEMLDKEGALRCQTASHVAHLLAPFAAGSTPYAAMPPQSGARKLTPGYGAWKAPEWQSPPLLPQPAVAQDEGNSAKPSPGQTPATAAREKRVSTAETPRAQRVAAPGSPVSAAGGPVAAPQMPIIVAHEPAGVLARPRRSRRANASFLAGVGMALVVIIAAVLFALWREEPRADKPAVVVEAAAADSASAGGEPIEDRHEIDDDGQTLWVSPTAGRPLTLNYLPSGAQLIVVLRPAELVQTPEGARVIDALGPAGGTMTASLRSTLGVELSAVEQLSIAFYPDEAGTPQMAFAMRLKPSVPKGVLLKAWGDPRTAEHNSQQYYTGPRWAYWLGEAETDHLAAIAPVAAMQELLDLNGRPLVAKGIERLLDGSDAARHVNLLLAPRFLLSDGNRLLVGDLEPLRDPLARLLGEKTEAVLVSAHLGDELFLELRAVGTLDQRPEELAASLRARLDRVPETVAKHVATLRPDPYGRQIVDRFPGMVRLLADFTRTGAEDRQAVLRAYLPLAAAHNLLLGAELALFERPAPPSATPPPVDGRAAAMALEKRVSLSFPRDTLENGLQLLAKEIDAEVVILGADLQLEGITKNQSFALDERDQPARDILLKILKLANSDGKLIYVIKPREDGGEAIFITTRAAAARRGDPLPATKAKTTKEPT